MTDDQSNFVVESGDSTALHFFRHERWRVDRDAQNPKDKGRINWIHQEGEEGPILGP